MFLGIDLDCGTTRPVMFNVANAPKQDASASMGIVGDLGAGKSVMEKLISEAVWARGGVAICIDRTPVREWASFARTAAAGRCQIIDAARAEVSRLGSRRRVTLSYRRNMLSVTGSFSAASMRWWVSWRPTTRSLG
ncbi:hypothetical protein GCM10010503_39120 [Streptomyces lucensis JCM 4490]|uniref:ATP/GTP-binding protein n=1 Tax=Streptomyces lucensis JCM 4490 TaxID=1306176 RepID=A0A918J8R5_9ACTN|nr:hypothetical protein GCM10010503_39120 [Streptomyces lucensis JCM 4490]